MSKNKSKNPLKKEDDHMATLAKSTNRMPFVRADNSKKFIEDFNKNIISSDFLKKCNESSKIFKKK